MSTHGPVLPIWSCGGCDLPWPCPTRRRELRAEYADAPVSLTLYLGGYLVQAAEDMPWAPAGPLHRRFIGWTRQPPGVPRRAAYSTPTLHAQLKALPWAQIPVGDQTRETGHGRTETRTVKAVTVTLPGGLGFPHAQQAVRITRTRTIKGKTTREMAYLTVSLPAGQAQPADLSSWARAEWHIENRVHYIRDVTLREDAHQARTGNGPAVFATLRNTSIGYHRTNGATNIAAATRRANHRPHDLIDAVTTSNPTMTRRKPTTQ